MLVGCQCMPNVKSWSKASWEPLVQDNRAWRIRSYAESKRITENVRHHWRKNAAVCPLRDSFSTLTQGHPSSSSRLSIKNLHCALWQLDDNNTHSQMPHTLFFLLHTTHCNFECLFFRICFLRYDPRWPQTVLQGRGRCVWLCVVIKCSPKESKVPEVSGSLHKYKCKMPVQGFFSCAAELWTCNVD